MTMFLQSLMPWINLFVWQLYFLVKKIWDSKCTVFRCSCCRKKEHMKYRGPVVTRCVTVQQYNKLYGGQQYRLHYQYSTILLQVYMALLYGMFVPILFPIVLFSIVNLYICEKINLAYIC